MKQEDILNPLIFLDIFDYPPTAMEIWRFLGVPAALDEVISFLDENWKASGFYFLPGRDGLVKKRRDFFQLSENKLKIAKRAARILRFIPSIKMIAVCNNFYYRQESDIDFFIIVSSKRLWLTRFFATVLLDFFNLRARGKETADKVCLSFYLSEADLNLENITLKPDDPYFFYWLAFLEPVYGQECYNEFWRANAWLKNVFPNASPKELLLRRRTEDTFLVFFIKKIKSLLFHGSLGDALEKIAKKIQWKKISSRVKEMAAADDTRVVINETMLKFHENDRRKEFREKFKSSIKNG